MTTPPNIDVAALAQARERLETRLRPGRLSIHCHVQVADLRLVLDALKAEVERLKAVERRTFPLQASLGLRGPVNIPWSVAEKAYGAYALRFGRGQTLERLAERGGFSWAEMDMFLPGWREECSEIDALRSEVERLREDAARYRWLREAKNLELRSAALDWITPEGERFKSTHFMQAGDTQFGGYRSLDELIDTARRLDIERAALRSAKGEVQQ